MRFHAGISFSWRTIKKFLIPFLLGVLAFFGFNFINDNKDNLPLGFIPVYAEEYDDISQDDIPDEIQDNYYYWSSILNEDQQIEHKSMFNKVYWFDDNTTEIGILSNIYILLFLYCITMILLRIISALKKEVW